MDGLPGAVLFCCTQNSIRSPIAESLLKHLHGRRIYVDSAGIRPTEVDPFAVAVMREIGIDVSQHRSKGFDDLLDSSFDVIVTMSPEAQHRAIELTRTMACDVVYWPTLDPSIVEGSREATLEAYRQVRDQILGRIKKLFPSGGGPQV
jgi:protein-tyrosine-phosphatase